MRFLHCMIRVKDIKETLKLYELLGLKLLRSKDYPNGHTLYFLATESGAPEIELTHNWGDRTYTSGDNFGHLAYQINNIYEVCEQLKLHGVTILRPPRDGRMARKRREPRDQLLGTLIAATLLIFFQAYMLAPIIPRLAEIFQVSNQTIGLVVPAYMIPYGITSLIFGLVSDRVGRRPVMLMSLF